MFTFTSFSDLIRRAEDRQIPISRVALEYEAAISETNPEAILDKMRGNLQVMQQSIQNGLREDLRSASGISGGDGYRLWRHLSSGKGFSGEFLGTVLYSALCISETNAAMGRIVAAPTAGSCGILPACLLTLQRLRGLDDDAVVMGLLNGAAAGVVIASNASIAGAEGGCQAECGSAAAMAASAMTEMMGGTPAMCGHACATALKSLMGLVCDPVAGLVEEPCIIRNASSAAVAVGSAEMALAGIKSIIPVDEVIGAMKRVGSALPEALRETAKGGLAATKTGKEITLRLHG